LGRAIKEEDRINKMSRNFDNWIQIDAA